MTTSERVWVQNVETLKVHGCRTEDLDGLGPAWRQITDAQAAYEHINRSETR